MHIHDKNSIPLHNLSVGQCPHRRSPSHWFCMCAHNYNIHPSGMCHHTWLLFVEVYPILGHSIYLCVIIIWFSSLRNWKSYLIACLLEMWSFSVGSLKEITTLNSEGREMTFFKLWMWNASWTRACTELHYRLKDDFWWEDETLPFTPINRFFFSTSTTLLAKSVVYFFFQADIIFYVHKCHY